jgi:hypothetical protein
MITIRHTHESGTLVEGSRKGDGVWEILKATGDNWKYSRNIGLYLGQSRDNLAKTWKIERAADALRKAGHEVTTQIDDTARRSFAEAEAERYERAEDRAGYHAGVAESAAVKADAAFGREHGILDMIPMGQPILLGHHSERRHRRDLERAESLRRRGMAEAERSEYHADRAEAAERYRDRRESVPTTLRRIAGLEADQRRIQRDLDGRVDYKDDGKGGYKLALIKPEGDYLARLQGRMTEVTEELAYWREHVATQQAEGVKVWGPSDFAKGDYAKLHGSWAEVLRINAKSVTVAFGVNVVNVPVVTKANAGGSTWTLAYDKVTARKSAAEMAEILAQAGTVTA